MAELTPTLRGDRVQVGRYVEQVFRVACGAAAATEWFATGFRKVIFAKAQPLGATGATTNVVLNCGTGTTGTSGSEDSTDGSVAIEASAAVSCDVLVRALL
jgi:hypothetical protein